MLPSLVMNSLSTLIVQLRSLARSPLHAHIREHRQDSAAKSRNGSGKSKPMVRKVDISDKMAENDDDDTSNVYISTNSTGGQLAGRCPRCLLDFRFKDTSTTSATTQSTGKCQYHRYRRSGRRVRKPRSSGSRAKSQDAALSEKSIEFLRNILSIVGHQSNVAGSEFTLEALNQLVTSCARFTPQQAPPRIGLFIEAIPPLARANPNDNLTNYADILLTIVRRLSTLSSQQIDRETQSMAPSDLRQMKLIDSSVQCDREMGLIDLPLNITILERHLDWTPVSVSSKPTLRLRTDSKRSLPPIAKRVVFKPGEDLILKLGGFANVEDDVYQIEKKYKSDCVCTVDEIPSNLVITPRCKDVTSLPVQGTIERAFTPRSHRSCTQSEYLTKTAMSLLTETHSSANVFALLNSDSFNSEKSKRNLGNFLLKERMKRFLSSILSQQPASTTSVKSDEVVSKCGEFGNPSSASHTFPRQPKFKRNVSLKWDLDQAQLPKCASSNETVSSSDVKSYGIPKSILIGRRQSPSPEYVDGYCQCGSRDNLDDVNQEELHVLRQILLRSCSFTETESACHLCLALDRKSLLRAVMAALRGRASEEQVKEMRRVLPRDCCSFAEYEPNRRCGIGRCSQTAGDDMGDDVITITTRIRFTDDDALFGSDYSGYGAREIEAPHSEKSVQTDGCSVISDKRSRSWSPGLSKDVWRKHLNFMAAS